MTDATHGTDPVAAFEEAIKGAGLTPPKSIEPDGRLHRFAPNGKANDDAGWYVLHADGEIPAGAFGNWRTGLHHRWSAKGRRDMTAAELDAYRRQVAEQRRQREEDRRQRQARARERAQEIWGRAQPASADHPYLQTKQVQALSGLRQDGDRLVIKVHDGKTVHGLQFIGPDGDKKFLQDTAKDGCYCGFGKPVDVIVIVEGYATGASVRRALEQPVAVAFDSGNLPKVARLLRSKLPHAQIIVAGDNDAHGKGQAKSREAAQAVGGVAIVPPQQGDDWNDVDQRDGPDAVRQAFQNTIYGPQPPTDDAPPPNEDDYGANPPAGRRQDDGIFASAPFRVLGYNRDVFYYYPYNSAQIIELPTSRHRKESLLRLCNLSWWERHFMAQKGVDWTMAADALFRAAESKGVFHPSKRRRGRGIWFDDGRAVFNLGDRLMVDGQECDFRDLDTRFVYEAGEPLSSGVSQALSARQASQLLDICLDLRWERGISAYLLAGWIMIAPLSGALAWRPHIWITGPAHSGKTTVVDDIVGRCLREVAFTFEGKSTESAMRQRLEYDALPIVFDEPEQQDERSRTRVQDVIDFARIASSGGFIYKGTQTQTGAKAFLARSTVCMSSIHVGVQHYQDETRFTPLVLRSILARDKEEQAANDVHYKELMRKISETLTPEYINGLMMRSVRLLPTILKNAETFTQAVASYLGNRRIGDQLGAMLAGAYALRKSREVTFDEAVEWIRDKEWSEHAPIETAKNEEKLLQAILQYPTRVSTGNGGMQDRTLGDLVDAARDMDQQVPRDVAETALKRHGIKYEPPDLYSTRLEGIYVSTSHSMLKRILKDTPWGTQWRGPLLNIDGAERSPNVVRFGAGAVTRAVFIPVQAFDSG